MFFIYILESIADGHYYVGHTDDFARRIEEHNSSDHPTYTSKHRPWKLIALFEVSEERKVAMNVEKFIKNQKSRTFIDRICANEKVDLPMAQLVIP
ncbi:MAG: GIY-YIG nuclease family protein [Lentimicrobium sp.]|nr:GIY-YIG nuclease family protein [Lentimicrobium sp.]MBW6492302.1 GIY-YIG nuclease family protein [Lentimicrobium sp.]